MKCSSADSFWRIRLFVSTLDHTPPNGGNSSKGRISCPAEQLDAIQQKHLDAIQQSNWTLWRTKPLRETPNMVLRIRR